MEKKKIFLLCGGPGTGKSTQVALIKDKVSSLAVIGVGDLMRNLQDDGIELTNALIKAQEEYSKNATPISAALIARKVITNVELFTENIVIIDNLIKTVGDYYEIVNELGNLFRHDLILFFDLSREEMIKRLSRRKETESRTDDEEVKMERRIERHFKELVDRLDELPQEKLVKIDASESVEKVNETILGILI